MFWIRAYYESETDQDRQWAVNSIANLNCNKLKSSGLSTQKVLADILIRGGKYLEALNILVQNTIYSFSWRYWKIVSKKFYIKFVSNDNYMQILPF